MAILLNLVKSNANDIIAFRSLILAATVNFMMWFYMHPGPWIM